MCGCALIAGGWACEEWRNLPEAGPAEQALLATHLLQARYPWLKQANSHTTDMPDTEKDDTSMQQVRRALCAQTCPP